MTTNANANANVDPAEVSKFNALANRWWDASGEFRPLHDINPLRMDFIEERTNLSAGPLLDVGCGGGLLSEGLAHRGATVTGIDMADAPLKVAQLHALEAGVTLNYQQITAEALAETHSEHFHTVTCLEVLEHVPDFASTVAACAAMTQPGGNLFFATINRNPKAYVMAVLGAEYVLNLLPKGTHEYSGFIKPAELAGAIRQAGLELQDMRGMQYNPFTHSAKLNRNLDVNYIVHARKPL